MSEPEPQLEFRAAQQIGVSYPNRTIELIVMPYETETQVMHNGRMITEIVARGAFNGVQRRTGKIKVNRNHNVDDPVGLVKALHPSRDEGLVAEVLISKERLEVLTMADEGILDASAGFGVMPARDGKPRGEEWRGHDYRRLTRLFLGHIALTPDPAYPTANVLAVRAAEKPTPAQPEKPNLFNLRLEELERKYAELDARFIR